MRGAERSSVVLVLDGGAEVFLWPLDDLDRPDLEVVDFLARLQLAARRRGWSIRLRNPPSDLCSLLELSGLTDVLTGGCRQLEELSLEARGEAEGGEQLGVEEVVETRDPPA